MTLIIQAIALTGKERRATFRMRDNLREKGDSKMESITGHNPWTRFVVHQDSEFEYGIISGLGIMYPYVAWIDGDEPVEVPDGEDYNCEVINNDDLLLVLAEQNPDAARWLFLKQPALDDPVDTVGKIIKVGVFPGVEAALCGDIDKSTIRFKILNLRESDAGICDTLLGYGWKQCADGPPEKWIRTRHC